MGDYYNGRIVLSHRTGIGSTPISPTNFMCQCNKLKFTVDMSKCIWRSDSCLAMDRKPKHQYESREDAYREINRLINESAGGVVGLRAYKCKHCKKWHLTSFPK